MTLNDVWFVLFVFIIAGYLILDGFDMGVGILHLPLARTDVERRTFLNSIGPVWDGNEVWLVLGGGVLFAVFPLVYASLFSGFYLAFMLVLLVLILRTVALEFRVEGAVATLAVDVGHDLRRGVGGARPALRGRVRERPVRRTDRRGRQHARLPDRPADAVRPARRGDDRVHVRDAWLDLPDDEDRRRAAGADQTVDAAADGDLLRPEHARRRGDGHVPAADHGPLHGADLAGHLPGARAPVAGRRVAVPPRSGRTSGRSWRRPR